MWKKLVSSCLILFLFSISLAGCRNRQEASLGIGIDGYVYVAKKVPLSGLSDETVSNWQAKEGCLYFESYRDSDRKTRIWRVSAEGTVDLSQKELLVEQANIKHYAVGPGQSLYYLYSESGRDVLACRDADGATAYTLQLPMKLPDSSAPLAVTGEEVYLLGEDAVYVVNGQGELAFTIPSPDAFSGNPFGSTKKLLTGKDGQVYYVQEAATVTGNQASVSEILSGETFQLKEVLSLSGVNLDGPLYSSEYGILLDGGDGIVSQYQGEERTDLFCWEDSGLYGTGSELLQLDEQHLLVYYGWGVSTGQDKACYLLTRTPVDELPKREALVLATSRPSEVLSAAVAEFNRTSENFYVKIETFEGQEGNARLDAALVGSDAPDLLDMTAFDLSKYANQNVLEDLFPYLEESDILNKEDFLDSVLEGYTSAGKLACLPNRFAFRALFGRASQVGQDAGWTPEEVQALLEQNPGSRLLNEDGFLMQMGDFHAFYLLDRFVDWERKTCSFDSDEFRAFTTQVGSVAREEAEYGMSMLSENVLLYLGYQIASGGDYFTCELHLANDEPVLKAYPTTDGEPFYPATALDALGITSKSDNKEGAWGFLEFFLQKNENDTIFEQGFPTRKSAFQKMLQEEQTPEYNLDENGEPVINAMDGKPSRKARFFTTIDGEQIPYYCLSQEQADRILQAADHLEFTAGQGKRGDILSILREELASYQDGGKTLEEAVKVLQSRVSILLQET